MRAHLETAKRVFETAATLGAKYVRVFSFYKGDCISQEEFRGKATDNLSKIVSLAKDYRVLPCHENEAGIYGESPENCKELLETFGKNLGCVFDMGNFVLDGFSAYSAYETLKDRITYFHIKDSLSAGAVVPPGKGEAQIKKILSDYKSYAAGDTFLTLEPHLQTFSGLNALVGKSFDNPFKYDNEIAAFTDAYEKFTELL